MKPSGGPWGSCYIDDQYILLLEKIFTGEWINEFKAQYPNGFLEIINTKLTSNFLKEGKNMILYYFYIISYLASAILNDYFQLSSKILN